MVLDEAILYQVNLTNQKIQDEEMLENIKFRKVERMLLQELMNPAFKVSDKLDSENVLMERFKVSKVTIRNALKRLEQDGIILCEHGKRRVLLRKPSDTKIRSGMSFGLFMRSEYLTSGDDLLGVARGLADGLREWNADLVVLPISGKDSELDFVKRVVGRNIIDGVFMTCMAEGKAIIEYLSEVKFPCVSFNNMEDAQWYDSPVPHAGLREIDILRGYCAAYRNVTVVGCRQPSLDRTCKLLNTRMPVRILTIEDHPPMEALADLLLKGKEDELILVASPVLFESLHRIAVQNPERNFRGRVLLFQHTPSDLSRFEDRFCVFRRPVEQLGQALSVLMREEILRKNRNEEPYNGQCVFVDAFVEGNGGT